MYLFIYDNIRAAKSTWDVHAAEKFIHWALVCWLTLNKSQSCFKQSIKLVIFLKNLHYDWG